uniref:Uncharacterized protein n=1 Tax=Magallana gigas TaxID=29159 RepID=K1Q7X4_MAGGI
MLQLGHLEIPLGARIRAPAAELGRKNPTHNVVSKSAPNPIADLNDRVRASAPNPIADLDDIDEAEFNSDKVHVVTVEPMNEDEDAETLSPSKGKVRWRRLVRKATKKLKVGKAAKTYRHVEKDLDEPAPQLLQ